MLVHILFVLIESIFSEINEPGESFTFHLPNRKEITLTKPEKTYKKFKILSNIKDFESRGDWYYVHFLTKNISELQKYISIKASDELIKKTFVLYLTSNQIETISNISMIKKIEPKDKFNEYGESLKNNNKFIVFTAPNYKLSELREDYIIERIKGDDSYVIQIQQNELNENAFLKKKNKVINYLSEIPEVKFISIYLNSIPSNAVISGFTQKNNFDFKLHNSSEFYYLDRYLNNKGLTGENQIVTLLDDPIDIYHSMFHDDNIRIKLNTYMPNHRKIIYYNFKGNLNDLKEKMRENEHGTHVAGTIAGKSICTNDEKGTSYFNGNAPDSKILYAGGLNEVSGLELKDFMNKYHSRISSNSWGVPMFYNPKNYEYGKVAEKFPNLTFIFSAGNEYSKVGNFSIGDPGCSKNVLTVGSLNDFYIDYQIFNISSKNNPDLYYTVSGNFDDPWFSGSIGTEPGKTDILAIDIDKGDQCNLLQQNDLFFFYGNNLSWISNCDFNMTGYFIDNILKDHEVLKLLISKGDIHASRILSIDEKKRIGQSSYSSTGPANKGILKPDVMAPGTNIISAKSRIHSNSPHGCRNDDEADFTMMSGTSMACPNVAGGVALIHQYFQSGKWNNVKINLDSSTTRALVINSCKHPLNSKTPDNIFGHGTVDLSTIIPIDNDFGVQITRQNENEKPFVTEKGHVISKIKVDTKSNKKDLQITLSYLDPMLNMDSPIPITRDLDLIVISPSKKTFIGDHLSNGDTQHFSTNEKVIIRNNELEDGEYIIHVYANTFIDSDIDMSSHKQEFSVVASGPISNGYLEFEKSSECPCEQCDPKHPGFCLCNESIEIGEICQAKIETFRGTEGAFYVGPLEIKRIRFIYDKKIKYIYSKSRNPGRDSTIWVSKNCHLTLGEYQINGETNDEKSSELGEETKVNFGTNEVCIAIFNNNYMSANYIIEVSNSSKFKWIYVILISMAAIIIILIVLLSYLCCCRKKCCCGCCKCCNNNINDFITTESSQFTLNDRLISA